MNAPAQTSDGIRWHHCACKTRCALTSLGDIKTPKRKAIGLVHALSIKDKSLIKSCGFTYHRAMGIMDAHYSGQAPEEDPHQRMSLHETPNSFRKNSMYTKVITSTRQAQRDKHTTSSILRSLAHQRQKIIKPRETLTSRKGRGTVGTVSLQ